jgi:hypothetical protein
LPAATGGSAAAHMPPQTLYLQATAAQQILQLHPRRRLVASASATEQAGAHASTEPAALPPPQLMLHNTLKRCKEVFRPRPGQGNAVNMYVCGVTVYDYSHIGEHERSNPHCR